MDLEKLKPWNWFKHEESGNGSARQVPVKHHGADHASVGATGSLMRLHDEMDRWFDDAFKSFGLPSLATGIEPRLAAFLARIAVQASQLAPA